MHKHIRPCTHHFFLISTKQQVHVPSIIKPVQLLTQPPSQQQLMLLFAAHAVWKFVPPRDQLNFTTQYSSLQVIIAWLPAAAAMSWLLWPKYDIVCDEQTCAASPRAVSFIRLSVMSILSPVCHSFLIKGVSRARDFCHADFGLSATSVVSKNFMREVCYRTVFACTRIAFSYAECVATWCGLLAVN
jgi:hypothetical protein